jgi:hypothetical protein
MSFLLRRSFLAFFWNALTSFCSAYRVGTRGEVTFTEVEKATDLLFECNLQDYIEELVEEKVRTRSSSLWRCLACPRVSLFAAIFVLRMSRKPASDFRCTTRHNFKCC